MFLNIYLCIKMDHKRIVELSNLKQDYYVGSMKDILYRFSLIWGFISRDIPKENIEERNKLKLALKEWLGLCRYMNLELIESLIIFYNNNHTLNNEPLILYEEYTAIFEEMVNFLLGKIQWIPPEAKHQVAVAQSSAITAHVLNGILENS